MGKCFSSGKTKAATNEKVKLRPNKFLGWLWTPCTSGGRLTVSWLHKLTLGWEPDDMFKLCTSIIDFSGRESNIHLSARLRNKSNKKHKESWMITSANPPLSVPHTHINKHTHAQNANLWFWCKLSSLQRNSSVNISFETRHYCSTVLGKSEQCVLTLCRSKTPCSSVFLIIPANKLSHFLEYFLNHSPVLLLRPKIFSQRDLIPVYKNIQLFLVLTSPTWSPQPELHCAARSCH